MLLRGVTGVTVAHRDPWRAVDDGEHLPAGKVTVTLRRFLTEREQLAARDGELGVRINPGEDQALAAGHADAVNTAALVSVIFPAFTDGRGFSVIRSLRRRGYRGEIRAAGKLLPDQFAFLRRCGADTVEIADGEDAQTWLREARALSLAYQSGYAPTAARNILEARAQARHATLRAAATVTTAPAKT